MARKQKTIIGKTNSAPAQRQFTDREEPQKSFVNALDEIDNKEYNILTYYGVGGIGKSSLQKHLKSKHLDKDENNIYSWVDFDTEVNRVPHKAFRILAQNFKSKFKINFTAFDIAYLIYWSKAFPDHDIKKDGLPFIEEGSILADSIDALLDAGGIMGVAFNLVNFTAKKIREEFFDKKLEQELKNLNSLEEYEIEKKLAIFFAYDIDIYKKKNPSKKIVIFMDTYEALWKNNRSDANYLSQDEWVRDFVTELPNVLFILCGREKIRWEEADSDWKNDLDQHILGSLSQDDAKAFLVSCGIQDVLIQDKIIASSEGLPYYLDLCVDTYYQMKDRGVEPHVNEFDNVGKDKIFERFMRYLSHQEQETLKVLANAGFYTKNLFTMLITEFKTGYPVTAMYQLNKFSFIHEENGNFFIHDLMRKSLISFQDNELNQDVNNFLFNYYNSFLQNLDIKKISQVSIEALPEAFYHKEQLGDAKSLEEWYALSHGTFKQAAKYKVLLDLSIRLKDILEKSLGDEHPDTTTSYNNLASIYQSIGDYEKALPLSKKALTIRKKVLGEEHPDTVINYNNLAVLYQSIGDYEKALPLYKKVLVVHEKVLGEEHPDTATNYNNLAALYQSIGDYEEALLLSEKALVIRKKVLGEEHLHTAMSYNNLAELYRSLGNYTEAFPLYKKALAVHEKVLGEEHPDTATTHKNLAMFYQSIGDYEKALPLYKKALAVHEKVLGEEHSHTATTYKNLAMLYLSIGDYEKALPLCKKDLTISTKVLGEEHPDTAASYNNLAVLYDLMKDYEKALPLYEKALTIYEKVLGEEHPDIAERYDNLVELYRSMGEYKKGLPLLKKALVIREKVLGKDHPNTTAIYNNLAVFYYNMGNIDNAMIIAKKGLGEESNLYQQLLSLKDS